MHPLALSVTSHNFQLRTFISNCGSISCINKHSISRTTKSRIKRYHRLVSPTQLTTIRPTYPPDVRYRYPISHGTPSIRIYGNVVVVWKLVTLWHRPGKLSRAGRQKSDPKSTAWSLSFTMTCLHPLGNGLLNGAVVSRRRAIRLSCNR